MRKSALHEVFSRLIPAPEAPLEDTTTGNVSASLGAAITHSVRGETWEEIRRYQEGLDRAATTRSTYYRVDMAAVERALAEFQPGQQGTPILVGVNQVRAIENDPDFVPLMSPVETHTVDASQPHEVITEGAGMRRGEFTSVFSRTGSSIMADVSRIVNMIRNYN